MHTRSKSFQVRARGPIACFTRPEMKVERVSYEVMTPSAARGLLEAIFWKPAIRWEIHEIGVLAPIRWTSFRRNEVNGRASPRVAHIVAEDDRAQRNTLALRDVDYAIRASFTLTPKAGAEENVRKFEEMFERRLEKGQHFQQPYLGCREFAAHVEPMQGAVVPIEPDVAERPLGMMLFDFDYDGPEGRTLPRFFDARLSRGTLKVPAWADVIGAARAEGQS